MTARLAKVSYHRLSPAARQRIKGYWTIDLRQLTVAGYVRHTFPDGQWGGDECGCTDDRCIGYHHDAVDDCGCLPVLLDEYAQTTLQRAS